MARPARFPEKEKYIPEKHQEPTHMCQGEVDSNKTHQHFSQAGPLSSAIRSRVTPTETHLFFRPFIGAPCPECCRKVWSTPWLVSDRFFPANDWKSVGWTRNQRPLKKTVKYITFPYIPFMICKVCLR